MKKYPFLLFSVIIGLQAGAQNNVGIGLSSGIKARLHVTKADSGIAIFQNSNAPQLGDKSMMYLMNGDFYSGAIGTQVTKLSGGVTPFARLGFYTFASANPASLLERLSITDNGNVGIGITTPDALLHVDGLTQTSALKVTTGAGIGKLLTSDASGNATWQNAPAFTLPFEGSVSKAGTAFSVTNTNNTQGAYYAIEAKGPVALYATSNYSGGTAIIGYAASTGGVGIEGRSRTSGTTFTGGQHVGVKGITTADIGIQAVASTGLALAARAYSPGGIGASITAEPGSVALQTSGGLTFKGINEGAGKVLTSDGGGNATWQPPVSGTKIGFSARLSNSIALTANTEKTLTGYTELFDNGNIFNPVTGVFTAPSDGVYLISFRVSIAESGTNVKYTDVSLSNLVYSGTFNYITPGINSGSVTSNAGSVIVDLTAGSPVALNVTRSNATNVYGGNTTNTTLFSVVKLY